MQPDEKALKIEPVPDGRPYLGDLKTVSGLVERFTRTVLRTLDEFHAGTMERQKGIDAIEALCMEYGSIFAGSNAEYQAAPWHGPRLSGRIMAQVPGSKYGKTLDDSIAEYFRWLSKQVIKVHTEMHGGMADEEAGPVVRQGMREAVSFLVGAR